MINFENVLRSFPGYILNPAATYEKNKDEGYSYAIATLAIPYAAIILLSGLLLVINDILTVGTIQFALDLLLFFVIYTLVIYSIQIPIIMIIIYCASKIGNRYVKFVDSFKISLIGYTFYIFTIGIFILINVLFITFDVRNNTVGLIKSIAYPFYILASLLFIRASAEGIKVLHGLSGLKSYAVSAIAVSAAYIAIYLSYFRIVTIFQFIYF
jgi:hypothetical protein